MQRLHSDQMTVLKSNRSSACRRARLVVRALMILASWVMMTVVSHAAELKDQFGDRELLTANSGTITGSNTNATRETDEPQHADKPGGRSVWISWVAPTNGIATFRTADSSFDTLLAAYYFKRPTDTALDELEEAASNDDDNTTAPASSIRFGAEAGVRYEIAVDGYRGAIGDASLEWDFTEISTIAPVIVDAPKDRALRLGDPLTLSVDLQTSPDMRLQWRFNGESFGEEGPTLFIPSLQVTNVGRYSLRIRIGEGGDEVRFETPAVEIQINSEGQTNALARDKIFDAVDSPLTPDDDDAPEGGLAPFRAAAAIGVSRGYNGSQVFNTLYATPDPAEPNHCGLTGSASYWYAYQPPADGTLVLDSIGSSFDTFIAAYTFNPPLTSYADLIPLTCDNDSAGTNGAARLEFAAPKNRQFLVVLDGINGARGIAYLNYWLDTNRPPVPPTLMEAPASHVAPAGSDVNLQPAVLGSTPLHFTWSRGTNVLSGATNMALQLTDVGPASSGEYVVTVSSHVGPPLNVLLPLRVLIPPTMGSRIRQDGSLVFTFPTEAGQRYFLEHTDGLGNSWQPGTLSWLGDGSLIVLTNSGEGGKRFYRLRVE